MIIAHILCAIIILPAAAIFAQNPARVAVIDFAGDEGARYSASLRHAISESAARGFELIDPDLTAAAAKGAGYAGSLNLGRDEARALGQSLGCDFYILGKVLLTRRVGQGEQHYYEALAGIFIVESRTGKLLDFSFLSEKSQNESEASDNLRRSMRQKWRKLDDYPMIIAAAVKKQNAEVEGVSKPLPVVALVIRDDEMGVTDTQPNFYNRLKPGYTEQADLAGITATVDLEAVFLEDGRVGDVEVIRWAGFGLDESAVSTVRLLKFKPAERDGKRLTIRGLVRYNFRRPLTQAAKPKAADPEEIEKLRRSIRNVIDPPRKPWKNPELKQDRNPDD
ncbi:MAG: energy transducer TonB [Acidobacteria bacterium]|nr:energy transducer TonB [Acidobacteriota bacterium]